MGTTAPRGAAAPADEAAVVHVLNRVTFGPRPEDVARVRDMGIAEYIDEQLRPERIADPGMDGRLAGLETLGLTSRDIAERYERPLFDMRRDRRQTQPGAAPQSRRSPGARQARQAANAVLLELGEQKMLRAAHSERQLQEVLADFWFNHFNVDARKGPVRFLLTEYEREAIRPHVLGRFRELLGAVARSPAMLFYLDNWMSASPASGRGGRRRGLNENYARELMELHTLGVEGGYTQRDVTDVARAFTGWTIDAPRLGGDFRFDRRIHDAGEKTVLGHVIKAGGGVDDGEQVLDLLASHPSTARFIALKLARRFVSDTPPPALVDRVTGRFRETDGDLREVVRAVLTSPEFLAETVRAAKVKTPLEFVVSALRASSAEVSNAAPLVAAMQQLGMPLYQCQPPTGYKDVADAWTSAGALVNRMNFALALASNRLPGIATGADGTAPGPASLPAIHWSETTAATLAKATTASERLALALGSPEFQKR
jgi:uncharacterized protein (DUF1800 family)